MTTRKSKFAGVLSAARAREAEPDPEVDSPTLGAEAGPQVETLTPMGAVSQTVTAPLPEPIHTRPTEPVKAYPTEGNGNRPPREQTAQEINTLAPTPQPERRIGRPRGKRSDPDYEQVTAYIRRDTYKAARRELFDEEREFSELVQELVEDWLRQRVAF